MPPVERPRASSMTVPAPIGGWNARDSSADMPVGDAQTLDNWFPDLDEVRVRGGCARKASGLGGPVKTLAEFYAGTVRRFLAAAGGKIQDVTGSAPQVLASGFADDRWQTFSGNNRLFFFNGSDAGQVYDGATISPAAFTGANMADVVSGFVFKGRPFLIEKNSQRAWYGTLGAVQGALTPFDLAQVRQFGGNLVGGGSLTLDAGDGVDDLLCLFMSSGEVLVYQGTDPGADFSLVGVFYIGAPIGYHFLLKFGPELLALTREGYVPVGKAIRQARGNADYAISDKVSGEATACARSYGALPGWEILVYPQGNKLIVNVPMSDSMFVQHVMNTKTKAWCRFKGWDATCWGMFNDEVYFGRADGVVMQADVGTSDDGSAIQAFAETAHNYFSAKGRKKRFTSLQSRFRSDGGLPVTLTLNPDFRLGSSGSIINIPQVSTSVWDEAVWDEAEWADSLSMQVFTKSLRGMGYGASLSVEAALKGQTLSWLDTTFLYEVGGVL